MTVKYFIVGMDDSDLNDVRGEKRSPFCVFFPFLPSFLSLANCFSRACVSHWSVRTPEDSDVHSILTREVKSRSFTRPYENRTKG